MKDDTNLKALRYITLKAIADVIDMLRSDKTAKTQNEVLNKILSGDKWSDEEKLSFLTKIRIRIEQRPLLPSPKYNSFQSFLLDLVSENPLIKEFKEKIRYNLKENISKKRKKEITAFEWKKDTLKNGVNDLYNLIINNSYKLLSAETPKEIFEKAFSGKTLEAPLNIKWLPVSSKNQPNKAILIYFFNALMDRNLIEVKKSGFYDTLHLIFCDKDGNSLNKKGFKSSKLYAKEDLSEKHTTTISDLLDSLQLK